MVSGIQPSEFGKLTLHEIFKLVEQLSRFSKEEDSKISPKKENIPTVLSSGSIKDQQEEFISKLNKEQFEDLIKQHKPPEEKIEYYRVKYSYLR